MNGFKSIYALLIQEYINFKQSLGYKFELGNGLQDIDSFFSSAGSTHIGVTRSESDQWCSKRPNETDVNRYKRSSHLRDFSRFLNDIGYESYVPRLPKNIPSTYTPHIFTKDEMIRLFSACDQIDAYHPNSTYRFCYPVFIRILSSTGLRKSEAIALTVGDVDLDQGTMLIREPKNERDRLLPFSSSLLAVLKEYSEHFNVGAEGWQPFLRQLDGKILNGDSAYRIFRKSLKFAGIPHGGRKQGPCLHCLRHSFACASLAKMAEEGLDLYYCLPILSKYLGHASLEATEGYVRMTENVYPGIIADLNQVCPSIFPEVSHEESN